MRSSLVRLNGLATWEICKEAGWETRPISDIVVKFEPLMQTYGSGEATVSPITEFRYQLKMMMLAIASGMEPGQRSSLQHSPVFRIPIKRFIEPSKKSRKNQKKRPNETISRIRGGFGTGTDSIRISTFRLENEYRYPWLGLPPPKTNSSISFEDS